MGNLVKKTKEAFDILYQKQEFNQINPSPRAMADENEAYVRWDRVAGLEEKYLKQKSKLHWLQVGDKNNKYFHRAVASRQAQNSIRELKRHDGSVTKKGEEIKEEAEHFFRELLQLIPDDYLGVTIEEMQDLLLFRCSALDKELLTHSISAAEIKKVLFAMPNDKSPGLDGFNAEFYKLT